ncbi:MAG: permease [Desulfobacterales bacterium]
MSFLLDVLLASWQLLQEAAVYILFGLLISGLLRAVLEPGVVVRHLGKGRFRSVFKAALLGIPLPLCSCGVLPAAATLKKQGANKGATAAFMISTPESGVDSIAVSYALLDPILTLARPLAAFLAAATAGVATNLLEWPQKAEGSGSGGDPLQAPGLRKGIGTRLAEGLRYALTTIWADLAPWFFLGLLLAGGVMALVPADWFGRHLGGGVPAMLLMLVVGIPIYICASASTPIAAALILKGVSPGAALVFLLVGPATNLASLTVLWRILGRRAAAVYLVVVAFSALACGLAVDALYASLGWSAQAVVGQAAEIIPAAVQWGAVGMLLVLSFDPLLQRFKALFAPAARSCPTTCRTPGPGAPALPQACGPT